MTRPRTTSRTSADLDLPRLAAPWAAYLRARRRAWTVAGHIERRYFRTQDQATYINERQRFTQFVGKATRTWTAAVLRAYSGAVLVAVGDAGSTHMPPCFLVRVPKKGSMQGEDYICGAVRPHDSAGQERLRDVRTLDRAAREIAGREAIRARLHAKMVHAATTARERITMMDAALFERAQLPATAEFRSERARFAAQSYTHRREFNRRWHIARKYEARLLAMGYAYDLATLAGA